MRLGAHTRSRWWVVLGISITTAVICLWPKEATVKPVNQSQQLPTLSKVAVNVSGSARVKRSAAEFQADQKEKRIQRILAGVAARLAQPDLVLRSEYFTQQVESLADEDVPLLFGRLDAGLQQSEFGVLLFRRWMTSEPATAVRWVETLPAGEARHAMLTQAALVWAEQDTKAAISWAQALADTEVKQQVLTTIADELVGTQPQEALQLTTQLVSGTAKQQVMSRALAEWAAQEPVNALRWMARVEDHASQLELRKALIPVIAAIDGDSGARLTVAWLKPGAEQERVAVAVVQRWAQTAPDAAAEWVNRFPVGAMRDAAVDNFTKILLAQKQDAESSAKVGVLP